jgi:hypothetical protein
MNPNSQIDNYVKVYRQTIRSGSNDSNKGVFDSIPTSSSKYSVKFSSFSDLILDGKAGGAQQSAGKIFKSKVMRKDEALNILNIESNSLTTSMLNQVKIQSSSQLLC